MPKGVLRDRNFLIYSLGNTISWLGTWAQRVGIGWLSWDLTHRTSWVGAIALAQVLPLVFFGPLFGALLDRHNHRLYGMSVNTALGVLALILYALTVAHMMRIALLLCLAVLLGIANSGYQAARLTMISDVVAPELLPRAIAINAVLFNATRAIGPAIAAVLIARFGLAAAFAANAASFVGIIVALGVVRLKPRQYTPSPRGLLAESRAGLSYVLEHEVIRRVVLLSATTSLLARGVIELLPAFADSVFHRGSVGLAHLTTAVGVGAIGGALVLSHIGEAGARLRALTRCAALSVGLIVVAFSLCRSFTIGLVAVGALGFAIVLCGIGLQVLLQSAVRDDYRGRVLGLWTAVNVAAPGVGSAIMGSLAQLASLETVTLTAGVLSIALVGWMEFRRPPQFA
jgi:MFS family permease